MTKNKNNVKTDFFRELARTLISVIEEKGAHLSGHSERVAGRCVNFSRTIGLSKKEIDQIYLAGLFHDIGMVYIPMEILQKPGKLSDDEMAMVKQHPVISGRILSNLSQFKGVIPIIRNHHEIFRGGGYPDGLKGDAIPIGSRVLHLVDSYEAMISARTFRAALGLDEALDRISRNPGGEFDPSLLGRFVDFTKETATVIQVPAVTAETEEKKGKKKVRDFLQSVVEKFRTGLEDLPVLPKVVHEIERVINAPDSDARALSEVIERDAAISIRLISISNSPVFRGAEKIHTVQHAVTRLGLKETRNTVLTIANKSIYTTRNRSFMALMQKMWLHSLSSAYAARGLAGILHLEDPDRYFLMGLIHDIGKVLLFKTLTERSEEVDPFTVDEVLASVQEFHCAFGAGFLEKCKFTRDFVEVAMFHEKPKYFQTSRKGILVVNLANHISRSLGYALVKDEETNLPGLESAQLLGAGFDKINSVADEVVDLMKTTADIF